jgi:RNA polymerase subunit RPABC4/transcription elongation factor Spt4
MFGETLEELELGKYCKQCQRSLPEFYEDELCPSCKEANLFAEVKDFIRSNDVKETDVAEHFDIPVGKVRKWIREGRIQYRGKNGETISSVHCQICGKPIDFGTLCPECHRLQGLKIVAQRQADDKSIMRFLDKDKK